MSLDEQWKYEKAYELTSYKMGPARFNYTAADISSIPAGKKYLDVGCGRGEMIDLAISQGVIAHGIETVPQLCKGTVVSHGDISDIPFVDDLFEYVSCYDVLEHLIPGEEQKALDELGRVCSEVLFLSTNDRPSHLPTGEDLHINKRPQADWHADIVKRWGDENVDYNAAGPHGDWHWVIRMP